MCQITMILGLRIKEVNGIGIATIMAILTTITKVVVIGTKGTKVLEVNITIKVIVAKIKTKIMVMQTKVMGIIIKVVVTIIKVMVKIKVGVIGTIKVEAIFKTMFKEALHPDLL